MIDVFTDWCGWCKRMDASTFSNPVIAAYLNENFYPVKFNAERTDSVFFGGQWFVNKGGSARSTHQLAEALLKGQLSYPTIVYLNEKLELLGPIAGYKTPEALEAWLVFVAQEKYKTTKFDDFVTTFKGQVVPTAQ
jgi:thioredoxin-related protein